MRKSDDLEPRSGGGVAAFWTSRPGVALGLVVVFVPGAAVVALGFATSLVLVVEVGMIAGAWAILRLQGIGWAEVGLRRPRRLAPVIGLAVAATIGLLLCTFIAEPVVRALTGHTPDLEAFGVLRGNLPALLAALTAAWTVAAFGEEMLFRAFLLTGLYRLLPGGRDEARARWGVALVASSAVFGLGHAYQGIAGMILTGLLGLGFGAIYLASGRDLWPAILSHGLYDTVGLVMLYLGMGQVPAAG